MWLFKQLYQSVFVTVFVASFSGQSQAILPSQESRFNTEPTWSPQILNISHVNEDRKPSIAPGYLFFTPSQTLWGWGPQIYDATTGELIWNGNNTVEILQQQQNRGNDFYVTVSTQEFHACDYQLQLGQHLCWHETRLVLPDRAIETTNRIIDSSYKPVGQGYNDTGENLILPPDGHEFNVLPGGETFLQPVGNVTVMDLQVYTGEQDGYVLDNCFQEVNMATGVPFFSWCALDHVQVWESYVYFQSKGQNVNLTTPMGGEGTITNPWDYSHINSIDKNEEGDYLISCRHLDQLLKIAGPNSPNGESGKVLWRLGGRLNEFELLKFNFSRQHHARYLNTTNEETTIAFFDNAWEGISKEPSSNYSSGKIIKINNSTMTAELVREYPHPEGKLTGARGSMQVLPNNNVLVGWGSLAALSEYSSDGTILYHVSFKPSAWKRNYWDYRSYKYPWKGYPSYPPKLLAYSKSCNGSYSPLMAYASWNGATEIHNWRFSTSTTSLRGPWLQPRTVQKAGFETKILLGDRFQPFVRVEALDDGGKILSSTTTMTFVPNAETSIHCDEEDCLEAKDFDYNIQYSCAASCKSDTMITFTSWFSLLIFTAFVETCNHFYSKLYKRLSISSPISSSMIPM